MTADLEVEIGGKVFWDLDDNDIPGGTEGVANTTVEIVGMNNSEIDTNVTTNEFGVWSLFVPIDDEYQVTVSKEGFSTEVYNISNSSAYPVHSDPESHDIEMTAGNVVVSGNVTDINDASRLNGSTVVLYPSSGMAGDVLNITPVFANDTLTWSAVIAPGEWIVVVTQADAGENGGGVAVGLLDASISDGATLDLEMSLGGWIDLTTSWTSIDLADHHAGADDIEGSALLNESVSVTFGIGSDIEWDMPVGNDGTISILMPAEEIEMDSSFVTIQHDLNLEMEYIGGAVTLVAEGRSPVALSYNRIANSDTSITMVENSLVNATVDAESELAFEAIEEEEAYKAIEFDLNIQYDGTETSQVFDVVGQIGIAPDEADWSIEFWDGTNFVESHNVTLGIGEDSNDTTVDSSTVLRVRILAPNQSDAWHLEEPHSLKVRLSSDATPSSEIAVTVQVPQIYDFEFSNVPTVVGLDAGSQTFGFDLTNLGNGDDSFTIELADNIPEDWEITPMQSVITITKDVTRSQMFTVFSATNFTEGTKTVTVTVTSSNGQLSDTFDVDIIPLSIRLDIDQGAIRTLSESTADTENQLVIPVTNLGLMATGNVEVSAKIVDGKSLGTVTISLDAESTTNANFTVSPEDSSGTVRFEVTVEVLGEDSGKVSQEIGEDKTIDFSFEYYIDETTEESPWFTLVIFVIGALVVYGGVRLARSRSSSSRF